MDPRLIVVTPCSRPQNLRALQESIVGHAVAEWIIVLEPGLEPPDVEATIIQGETERAFGGFAHRNLANGLIEPRTDRWVWGLDDDNLAHPDLTRVFIDNLAPIIIWAQDRGHRAGPSRITNVVDTAQFAVRADIATAYEWPEVEAGDGMFIERICDEHPDDYRMVDRIACYRDRLGG